MRRPSSFHHPHSPWTVWPRYSVNVSPCPSETRPLRKNRQKHQLTHLAAAGSTSLLGNSELIGRDRRLVAAAYRLIADVAKDVAAGITDAAAGSNFDQSFRTLLAAQVLASQPWLMLLRAFEASPLRLKALDSPEVPLGRETLWDGERQPLL